MSNRRICERPNCTRIAFSGPVCGQHTKQEKALGLRGKVDNKPVIAFMRWLIDKKDFTAPAIAEQAGVSYMSVYYQLRGERKSIRAGVARKIMAINPDVELPFVPHTTVDGLGFVRRVYALGRMDWSMRDVAERLGVPKYRVSQGVRSGRVAKPLLDAMVALYEEVSHLRGPTSRAGIYALKAGRPAPLDWNDIDDPAEVPTMEPQSGRKEKAPLEEVLHFHQFGMPPARIADRLGVSTNYVHERLKEAAA